MAKVYDPTGNGGSGKVRRAAPPPPDPPPAPIQWNPNGPRTWNSPFGQYVAANTRSNNEVTQNAIPTSTISSTPASVPPPPSPPSPPAMITAAVKQADPSIIQYNEQDTPKELLTFLLYEDVSGTELINISRHDTINGQQVGYSLIKNLSILNKAFNPNNILAGQTTYAAYLDQYAIDLPSKLPSYRETYIDENGNQISDDINIVYLENGDLIIEFTKLNDDEFAEIQISTNGTIYSIGA